MIIYDRGEKYEKRASIEAYDKIEDQLIKDAIDDVGYTVEAIQ